MNKQFITLFFLFFYIGFSQENTFYGAFESNGIYYSQNDSKDFNKKFKSNNYFNLNYLIGNKWKFDLQLESYLPGRLQNFSENLDDTYLSTLSANYKTKSFDFSIGSIYEQFGSGLILRTWEDRQLGINNSIWGIRTKFESDFINLKLLAGYQKKGREISKGKIIGFDSEILLNENFQFGLSYVGRLENIAYDFGDFTNLFSSRLDYNSNSFYMNYEYISKSKDGIVQFGKVSESFVKPGSAHSLNFGTYNPGFGIDITFRRLENMGYFSDRFEANGDFLETSINYLPALTKQHDYLLTNISVYQAQPYVSFQDPTLMKAGEIGFQLDLYYNFEKESLLGGKYGTKLSFNSSLWNNLGGDYSFSSQDYTTSFFDFGEKYFSEQSLEISKKVSKSYNYILLFINRYYNKRLVEERTGEVNSKILVLDNTIKLNNKRSVKFDIQHLFNSDDHKNWFGYGAEYNFNYNFSIYYSNIKNYQNIKNNKPSYYSYGISYSKNTTKIIASYGKQRGGLICYGGVCRYVPEFKGFSISFNTTF
jgi:hypothetical protein